MCNLCRSAPLLDKIRGENIKVVWTMGMLKTNNRDKLTLLRLKVLEIERDERKY